MKSARVLFLFLCQASLGLAGWAGAQDFDKVQIKSVQVAHGVYMLYGESSRDVYLGGNMAVLAGGEGCLLVDSQFGEVHEKIKAAIAEFCQGRVRFVLNTHGHYDHALRNELFRKEGAIIIAHENARKRMMTEQIHELIDEKTLPYPGAALPEVTFAETLNLHFNGEDIQAIYVDKAHTDNDVFYWFRRANVIHTGCLFFSGGYPYIDIRNGGSLNGIIAGVDRILEISDEKTKYIPGHGPLSDRKRLQAYRTMLVRVRDRVMKMVKEGKTLDDVVSSKPTADLDKDWQMGICMPAELFVINVYKDLSR